MSRARGPARTWRSELRCCVPGGGAVAAKHQSLTGVWLSWPGCWCGRRRGGGWVRPLSARRQHHYAPDRGRRGRVYAFAGYWVFPLSLLPPFLFSPSRLLFLRSSIARAYIFLLLSSFSLLLFLSSVGSSFFCFLLPVCRFFGVREEGRACELGVRHLRFF